MSRLVTTFRRLLGAAADPVPRPGDRVAVIARVAPLERGGQVTGVRCGDLFTVRAVTRTLFATQLEVDTDPPGTLYHSDVLPLERAVDYFTAVLARQPRDAEMLHARARVFAAVGDLDRARADQLAADRVGRNEEQAAHAAAVVELSAELADDPTSPLHFLARGDAHLARGELDAAVADYSEAIRLDPDLGTGYVKRGVAWQRKGEPERALVDFDAAIRLAPANPLGYLHRAILRRQQGDTTEALADLDEAVRCEPRCVPARHWRAQISLERGDLYQARIDCVAVLQMEPDHVPALLVRAAVWFRQGDYNRALADYDRVLQFDPTNVTAINDRGAVRLQNRGAVAVARGQHRQALADFDTALGLDPELVMVRVNRGMVRNRLGDYAGAMTDLEDVLRREPEHVHALNALAWLLATCPQAEFRDGRRAVELATHAVEMPAGANAGVFDTLACAYAEAGDFTAAVHWAMRAMSVAPEHVRDLIRPHLEAFRAGRPHREPPVSG